MHVTIELSEQNDATLETQARAAHMPKESYLQELVERALLRQKGRNEHGQRLRPRKSAYGLLAKYGPGPTEEEIDGNRREMFKGLGELEP